MKSGFNLNEHGDIGGSDSVYFYAFNILFDVFNNENLN